MRPTDLRRRIVVDGGRKSPLLKRLLLFIIAPPLMEPRSLLVSIALEQKKYPAYELQRGTSSSAVPQQYYYDGLHQAYDDGRLLNLHKTNYCYYCAVSDKARLPRPKSAKRLVRCLLTPARPVSSCRDFDDDDDIGRKQLKLHPTSSAH